MFSDLMLISNCDEKSFFKKKVGINDIKFALPHLSPKPLIVPWICLTPDTTAAKEFATALPVSLCACIPRFFPGTTFETSFTICETSWGSVPPFVSHKTIHLAP